MSIYLPEALATTFLGMLTSTTSNDPEPPKIGSLVIFLDFRLRHTFQKWIASKWLAKEQDNLRTKCSALNLDFSNTSSDPLGSRKPAHVGVKEWYPSKKWLFICCWLV